MSEISLEEKIVRRTIGFLLAEGLLDGRGLYKGVEENMWTISTFDFEEAVAGLGGHEEFAIANRVLETIKEASGRREAGGAAVWVVPEPVLLAGLVLSRRPSSGGSPAVHAAHSRNRRLERKAAAANRALEDLRTAHQALLLEHRVAKVQLEADGSLTRQVRVLTERLDIIRTVVNVDGADRSQG